MGSRGGVGETQPAHAAPAHAAPAHAALADARSARATAAPPAPPPAPPLDSPPRLACSSTCGLSSALRMTYFGTGTLHASRMR
eukprot:2916328-Pleurochrysis_carterae.AAC.1